MVAGRQSLVRNGRETIHGFWLGGLPRALTSVHCPIIEHYKVRLEYSRAGAPQGKMSQNEIAEGTRRYSKAWTKTRRLQDDSSEQRGSSPPNNGVVDQNDVLWESVLSRLRCELILVLEGDCVRHHSLQMSDLLKQSTYPCSVMKIHCTILCKIPDLPTT